VVQRFLLHRNNARSFATDALMLPDLLTEPKMTA
jgi:hypothetical protein